jgi:hypothetical protein
MRLHQCVCVCVFVCVCVRISVHVCISVCVCLSGPALVQIGCSIVVIRVEVNCSGKAERCAGSIYGGGGVTRNVHFKHRDMFHGV